MKKLVLVGEVVELPLKVEVVAEEAAVEAEDAAHQTQGFMYLPLDPKKRKIRKTKTKMTDTIILLYVTLHHHRCTTIATTNKRTAKVPGTLDESEMAEGNHPQTITLQSKTAIEQQTTPETNFNIDL